MSILVDANTKHNTSPTIAARVALLENAERKNRDLYEAWLKGWNSPEFLKAERAEFAAYEALAANASEIVADTHYRLRMCQRYALQATCNLLAEILEPELRALADAIVGIEKRGHR